MMVERGKELLIMTVLTLCITLSLSVNLDTLAHRFRNILNTDDDFNVKIKTDKAENEDCVWYSTYLSPFRLITKAIPIKTK